MKIMIVDDERLARDRLRALVGELGKGEVVAEASNGKEAIVLAQSCHPDVVLLDIRMPGVDGVTAAEELGKLSPKPLLIFTTAFDDKTREAFDKQAVAYLMKPINKELLGQALERARALCVSPSVLTKPTVRTHISVTVRGELRVIPVNQIYYFSADQKYVLLHWKQGNALLGETLKDLEQEFQGQFLRIHRSTLVSVVSITGLHKSKEGHSFLRLRDLDVTLEVSRRHLPTVRQTLKDMRIPMF